MMFVLVLAFTLFTPAARAESSTVMKATPVKFSLSAEGKTTDLWAYEIDNSAYFKLRDVARLLSPSKKQFGIAYDDKTVTLLPGETYTPVGTELTKPSEGEAAYPSNCKFMTTGWWDSILSYTIGGSNYVKLSDLAAALGFSSTCDMIKNSAAITDCSDIPPLKGQLIDNISLPDKKMLIHLMLPITFFSLIMTAQPKQLRQLS